MSRTPGAGLVKALMVEDWNHTAQQMYRDLGLRHQALAAAAVPGVRPRPDR